MENNIFIVGKVANTPQIINRGETVRITFSVAESGTGNIFPVIADTSKILSERIKSGEKIEIVGTLFTRKIKKSGKTKYVKTVYLNSFSADE